MPFPLGRRCLIRPSNIGPSLRGAKRRGNPTKRRTHLSPSLSYRRGCSVPSPWRDSSPTLSSRWDYPRLRQPGSTDFTSLEWHRNKKGGFSYPPFLFLCTAKIG